MKSWAEWFVHRADERKRALARPCGFRQTDQAIRPPARALGTFEGIANSVLNSIL